MKLEQKLHLVPQGPINGFCYPYCLCLFKTLKALEASKQVFEKEPTVDKRSVRLTALAENVLSALSGQVPSVNISSSASVTEVQKAIQDTEEFLNIFLA